MIKQRLALLSALGLTAAFGLRIAAAEEWNPPAVNLPALHAAAEASPQIIFKAATEPAAMDDRFSAQLVVPELLWSWWKSDPKPIPGYLAVQLTGGGLFDAVSSYGPLVMVGSRAYGAGRPVLRVGMDGKLYLSFDTTADTELYCCLGEREPRREDGVWKSAPAEIADAGRKGFYEVGRLIGVPLEQMRHGTRLRPDQIRFTPGISPADSRRIQRGDRFITLESTVPPLFIETAPALFADKVSVDEVVRRSGHRR